MITSCVLYNWLRAPVLYLFCIKLLFALSELLINLVLPCTDQFIVPCWLTCTPSSWPWYSIWFSSMLLALASVYFVLHLAAFCNIGNSQLILKLIIFAYPEADASDTLPKVHWGCCLSKPSVFIATFLFVSPQHDWTLHLCTRVGIGTQQCRGRPQFAARQRVMTLGISLSERAGCQHLLSAFSTTIIFFAHAIWANRLVTKHDPQSPVCLCQHHSDIFIPPGCPREAEILVYSYVRGETCSPFLRTLRSPMLHPR